MIKQTILITALFVWGASIFATKVTSVNVSSSQNFNRLITVRLELGNTINPEVGNDISHPTYGGVLVLSYDFQLDGHPYLIYSGIGDIPPGTYTVTIRNEQGDDLRAFLIDLPVNFEGPLVLNFSDTDAGGMQVTYDNAYTYIL